MRFDLPTYRSLLAASLILVVAAGIADALVLGMDRSLGYAGLLDRMPLTALLLLLSLLMLLLVASVVSYIGLFLCRRWARTLSWVSATLVLPAYSFLPVMGSSGPGYATILLATAAWGGALAMAYSPTLDAQFLPLPARSSD